MAKIDGIWELGLLQIRDEDLGTHLTIREENLSPTIACWLTVDQGRDIGVIALTSEDINRMKQWLTKANQNLTERNRRARRGK